jgi:DNA-binding CsgD family transcriptional regulator
MRPGEPLDAAIAALYETVLDGSGWPGALRALAGCLASQAATLWRFDPVERCMVEAHEHGHDPEALGLYARHFVHLDPATPVVLAADTGRWLSDETLLDPRNPAHRAYFHEFARPHGLGRVGGGIVSRDADGLLYFGVQRGPRGPRFGAEGRRLFEALAPHLRRADSLRRRMDRLAEGRRYERAVIDRLGVPLCVVDAGGRVALANAAWGRLVGADAPLRVRHGHLRQGPFLPAGWLRRALADACGRPPVAAATRVGSARGTPWTVAVVPLPLGHDLADGREDARALLTLGRPEDTVADAALLGPVFGLTPAEANLLAALAAGHTVSTHAARRGVSVHTVRTQASALLGKMGCRSQVELVALARALPPWRET